MSRNSRTSIKFKATSEIALPLIDQKNHSEKNENYNFVKSLKKKPSFQIENFNKNEKVENNK